MVLTFCFRAAPSKAALYLAQHRIRYPSRRRQERKKAARLGQVAARLIVVGKRVADADVGLRGRGARGSVLATNREMPIQSTYL
jgi:hypothetical protein